MRMDLGWRLLIRQGYVQGDMKFGMLLGLEMGGICNMLNRFMCNGQAVLVKLWRVWGMLARVEFNFYMRNITEV